MAVKKDEATVKWMYYGSYKLNGKTKQYKKRGFGKKKDAIKAEIIFKENLKEPNATITFNELSCLIQSKFEILSNSDILKSECNAIAIFTQSYKDSFSACVIITVLGILVTEPFS